LRRRFGLDEEYLEDLKIEIIQAKQLATDEDNTILVWTGEATPTSVRAPERPPLAYTPAHLSEKILTARTALEGERKQVTVLFADIKGSTELIAGLDPEEARTLLGNDPGLTPLTQLLITRTQGNPFCLEESVRTLVETGGLIGDRGAYRLAQPLDTSDEALYRSLACLQAAEFLYETACFPSARTPLSTPLPMRWRMGVCCTSGGGCCTRALLRRWRPWRVIG